MMKKVIFDNSKDFGHLLADWFAMIEAQDNMVTSVVIYDNKEAISELPSAGEIRKNFPPTNLGGFPIPPSLSDEQKAIVAQAVKVLVHLRASNDNVKERDREDTFWGAVVTYDTTNEVHKGKPLRMVLKSLLKNNQIFVYG